MHTHTQELNCSSFAEKKKKTTHTLQNILMIQKAIVTAKLKLQPSKKSFSANVFNSYHCKC